MTLLGSTLRRLRREIGSWPTPTAGTVALVACFTCELFAVQELTLLPMHWQSLRSVVTYRVVRLVLDAFLCAALVSTLPRMALLVLFLFNPIFYVGVIVYHDYFHQPLSLQVVLNQSGEGIAVADAVAPLVRAWHAVFLASLAAKVALLLGRKTRLPWPARRRPSLALGGAYAFFLLLMNPLLQPLYKIGTWDSVSGLGSIYGYLPVWTAELAFIDADDMRARAVARAERGPERDPDRLTKIERSFPFRDRLIFLQVESFDYGLIDFRINGRPVTPQMNELWNRSLSYCVQAPKGMGSSDADFKALMGKLPSLDVPTYKIPNYPYDASFVRRLHRLGFRTAMIHGVTGEFFNRRPAYEAMGFDDLFFREEFERLRGAPLTAWTLPDDELLSYAAKRVAALPGRQFEIVITATSHIPFPLDPSKKVFFPEEDEANVAYFDSVHFVDAAIGQFVRSLPRETMVVIYGDHSSQVENPAIGYRQVQRDEVGCVPFMVHDVGENLRPTQRSGALATSCDVTLLEAMRFVHSAVEMGGVARTAEAPR